MKARVDEKTAHLFMISDPHAMAAQIVQPEEIQRWIEWR